MWTSNARVALGHARWMILIAPIVAGCGSPAAAPPRTDSAQNPPAAAAVAESTSAVATVDTSRVDTTDSVSPALFALPLGRTLGEWMREFPGEQLFIAAPGAEAGVVGSNSEGPLRGIWCARVTRVVREGPGWELRRQAYFYVRPPTSLPPRSGDPSELRMRYCRLVALAGELVGDSASEAGEGSGFAALATYIEDSTVATPRPGRPGWEEEAYHGEIGPDSTGRGTMGGFAKLGGDSACLDTDASAAYYGEVEDPACRAFFRVDTARGAMGVSDRTQPTSYGGLGGNLRWLADRSRFLSVEDYAFLEELIKGDPPGTPVRHAPDSATFQKLLLLHDRLLRVRGEDAPLALTILDAAASRALGIGRLGPPGDVAGEGYEMVRTLGVELKEWHLGGFSQDLHHWMDSALALGPDPQLGDSILVWHVVPGWPCTDSQGPQHAWGITRARPFTAAGRSAKTRARAWLVMAQQWADSAMLTRAPGPKEALEDSVAIALRAGLEADPRTEYAEAAHHALWRAAAGLRPLLFRLSCDEGD